MEASVKWKMVAKQRLGELQAKQSAIELKRLTEANINDCISPYLLE